MKKIFISVFVVVGILFGLFIFNNINDVEAKEDIIKKTNELVNDVSKSTAKNEIEEVTKVKVDIKGEVINPGVYELTENSRVIDQTTTNMIQRISHLFAINPLISKEI